MSLAFRPIRDAVVSHAQALGVLDTVNTHKPDNAPGHGVHAAVFVDRVRPVTTSGLSSTSVLVSLTVLLLAHAGTEPADDVDAVLLDALDPLWTAYHGDFTLGGLVRQVDIFGAHGIALEAPFGWIDIGDTTYRAIQVTLPLVVNDTWDQEA